MTHTAKVDGAQKARNEISSRIGQAEEICEQFKGSFKGYKEDPTGEKALVAVAAVIAATLLVGSPMLLRMVYSYVGYPDGKIQLISIIALYAVCLYLLLFIAEVSVNLSRIAKVDGYISKVNMLKGRLNQKLSTLNGSLEELDGKINTYNIVFSQEEDTDSELEQYRITAETYSAGNSKALDGLLKFVYWTASILFGIAFVCVSGERVSHEICNLLDISLMGSVFLAYAVVALAGFITANYFIYKYKKQNGLGSFVGSLLCGPAAIPGTWAICAILVLVVYAIIFILAIAIIFGLIGALANS